MQEHQSDDRSGAVGVLDDALAALAEHSSRQTDGRWLEDLTETVAPHIRDWNVDGCWRWTDWPDRDAVMPEGTPAVDVGIDLVARRRDDGRWVAIQCKARRLDADGTGEPVRSGEMGGFLDAAAHKDIWAERWLVVNGAVALGGHAPGKAAMSGASLRVVNVALAVEAQRRASDDGDDESCPHCTPGPLLDGAAPPRQTRSCMQRSAVVAAVDRLRSHERADEDGIPRGEARGRVVLPCGTGKTRIALRIVEELTYRGEMSVVLCPSIALVAQLRREFLQHAAERLRVMAVCSDEGVAADEERVANTEDATADRGMATTDEIKGCPVTTDSDEIAAWIRKRRDGPSAAESVSVIFGTYQSARRVADGIAQAEAADAFKVLVCDEAHRTAGVARRRRAPAADERLREFTLCHDRDAFPATYRVYQTATPRIYGDQAAQPRGGDYVVRHMDDQATFGVELYRRSYADAVGNGWLSDYRIIAMGVGGREAVAIANDLVREADEDAARAAEEAARAGQNSKARTSRASRLPTTGDYLKGMAFALAMGGAACKPDGEPVPLRSCIGFLNTIARSGTMARVLQSDAVRQWVARQAGDSVPGYRLEHLDASAPVARRDEAKRRLAAATAAEPHGVLNVGIFGEGTDSPSLSAVAFLEPRKSPIDVVQAVGRAMRRSPGKHLGYIVVPVVIPEGVDAERHLAVSDRYEGWRELGDILQALRAHDKRIEDALPQMLHVQLPLDLPDDKPVKTVIVIGRADRTRLEYAVATGRRDDAEDTARAAEAEGRSMLEYENTEPFDESMWQEPADEPTSIITHVRRPDGSTDTREDTVGRHKPKPGQAQGPVNARQTRRRAVAMARGDRGRVLPDPAERARLRAEREAKRRADYEGHIQGVLVDLTERLGGEISMNLLEKSGLTGNTIRRDLNLLADAVGEAARYLHAETGLAAALDAHFGFDRLAEPKQGKPRADGSTVAALLWMNAAMLHQRVHAGGWLSSAGIDSLAAIKASPEPEEAFRDSWQAITRQDFAPVIEPATLALRDARRTGRLGGLRRALRHLAAEAEQIAETYADMGADHAGALFNEVMGDQSSDGAFFTRPAAAAMAARLALDAVDPDNLLNWSELEVWRGHKTVDLACGSGTLLAAAMTEMKRRAVLHGADRERLAELQQVAVQETLVGLDINAVSLQLAATQLMAGNTDVKYRRMGLHLMPYGRQPDGSVAAGSLELFARREIVDAGRLFDDAAESARVSTGSEVALQGPAMDDAATAAAGARIVVMNPPFTNRTKMGEKFDKRTREALRDRMDTLEGLLAAAGLGSSEFLDKNSLEPRFAALADLCLDREAGVYVTVIPTVALTSTSNLPRRLELARRFHIHTILTCHQAADVNMSQHTNISESVVVMRRHRDAPPPQTRIVSLDRMPADDTEADSLFDGIAALDGLGALPDGWGEVSSWPAERIAAGDWTAAVWRSPRLAEAAAVFFKHAGLSPMHNESPGGGLRRTQQVLTRDYRRTSSQPCCRRQVHATGQLMRADYRRRTDNPLAFPVLDSKGAAGQQRIEAVPDEWWEWKQPGPPPILAKAGHLLVTTGQDTSTARLTSVASDERYVGQGWIPVTGLTPLEAKGSAVFLNSTAGRLLIMSNPGKKLSFPMYGAAAWSSVVLPDLSISSVVAPLAACWEATRHVVVPQFRDGYTEVRRRWDEAVCAALGWDIAEISELGEQLAQEPRVRGVAWGQWKP